MDNAWIIGMQPTVPTWVSWYRRVRTDRERARARAPNRIALYFNTRNDPHNPYIRLDQMLGQKHMYPLPSLATVPWRSDRLPLHDTFPIDVSWRVPDIPPDLTDVKVFTHQPVNHKGEGGTWWGGGAARGWGGGAALLVLLVLLVRAAERCIDTKLFKIRRRDSEEWPTANVMATSLQHQQSELDSSTEHEVFSETTRRDLPPPYSECAANKLGEEPPPPYSACYVSFNNPKDGQPSVHIHRRSSSEAENYQNNLIENNSLPSTSYEGNEIRTETYEEIEIRTELVFENGRIVERVSDNPDSNALEVSIDNVLEHRNVCERDDGQAGDGNENRVLIV